jgi:hypothetical protein
MPDLSGPSRIQSARLSLSDRTMRPASGDPRFRRSPLQAIPASGDPRFRRSPLQAIKDTPSINGRAVGNTLYAAGK